MATQPVENIEAVLGRFQAWTGTRSAAEAGPGIREISYEEALASGRYRWKGANANSPKKAAVKPGAGSEQVRVSAAPVKAETDKKRRAANTVRTPEHGKIPEHGKVREHGKAAREAKAGAPGKLAPESKGGGENHCAAVKAAAPGRGLAARPAFREVLAEAIRPAQVVAAQPMELARQVAISIRLAPSERALIKTRAAEAGITASAYVRQCVLEVEQLRAQVRSAVAAMERGGGVHASVSVYDFAPVSPAPVSTVPGSPAPGFFVRMFRRFFPGSAPALALRA